MPIQKEVENLEQELFKALEYAFEYSATRNYAKLKIALEAIRQLEIDYKSITRKNFIKEENITRLTNRLEELRQTLDEDIKALNEIIKKFK